MSIDVTENAAEAEDVTVGEINKYNFRTETTGVFKAEKGLNKEVVNQISDIKNEPDWMRNFRLDSLKKFEERPMPKWGGAIDNLGGDYLTWLTRTVDYGGNIASIGLAASAALNTTVLPFILRAVCLLGINSVDTPRDLRRAVWARIGGDLKPQHLDTIGHKTISFDELPVAFQAFIDGTVTGRVVVKIP